jgi:hypothetical protein
MLSYILGPFFCAFYASPQGADPMHAIDAAVLATFLGLVDDDHRLMTTVINMS